MSKKLPGLTRRAPGIPEEEVRTPAPEREQTAHPNPKMANRTKPKPTKAKPAKAAARRGGSAAMTAAKPDRKSGTAAADRAEVTDPKPAHPALPIPAETEQEIGRRIAGAHSIVDRRAEWAVASGLVPIPFVDVIAIAGVQIAMLHELSGYYGVAFRRHRAKSIVTALMGGVLPYVAGTGLAGIVGKSMPIIGWSVGLFAVSILAGASTKATGVVFIKHFETGGTFLDFDPTATRAYFRAEFEKARREMARG